MATLAAKTYRATKSAPAVPANLPAGTHLQLIDPEERELYNFREGFVVMGLILISRLIELKLPIDAHRLALLLVQEMGFDDGTCLRARTHYASIIGVRETRISTLLGMLEREDFIMKLGPKLIMLNPRMAWRGHAKAQRQAIIRWDRYKSKLRQDEMELVKSA